MESQQNAIALCREIGNRHDLSIDLGNLGSIYSTIGEFEKAIEQFQQALKIDAALGDEWRTAYHRTGLAYPLAQQGELEQALTLLDQSIPVLKAHGAPYYVAEPLYMKAEFLYDLGQYNLARTQAEEALALAAELKIRHTTLSCQILLTRLDFVEGQQNQAVSQLETLASATQDEAEQAILYYELWTMTGSPAHHQKAAKLCRASYQRISNFENKIRLDELEAGG